MNNVDRNQIERVVRAVLATLLKRQFEAGADITRTNTAGWDSLKHMEIMFALEDEFNTEFTEDELAKLDSFTKIVDAVQAKRAT
jgi:acyl carrier protein